MLGNLSHKELIKLAKDKCIPPLLAKFHKGQVGGRVCIIGGCEDYTGAPYFSANATALMGCDLTHVICEREAATVIKSYTPNLMVHPYLRDNGQPSEMNKIKGLVSRMQVLVIGPGLGRDASMLDATKEIIKYVLEEQDGKIPIVIDADGLFLICQDSEVREIIGKFPVGRIILTPNVVEFKRLSDAINCDGNGMNIAQKLNCIIFQKGNSDQIFPPLPNYHHLTNNQEGSFKRVGGQGDTLTGTIACMLSYSRAMYDDELCGTPDTKMQWVDYAMLSSYVGSTITRECAKQAFKKKGRAMQTTDLNDRVGEVYAKIFE